MNKQIIINKKLKQQQDRKNISGTKWTEPEGKILRLWDAYKRKRISAETLMNYFPGRTFHAIFSKVYAIRGRQGSVHKKNIDPNQTAFPFGGNLKS